MTDINYGRALETRENINPHGYSIGRTGSAAFSSLTEFLPDTTSDRIPNPLRFADEAFCAFEIRGGRIYRLQSDSYNSRVTTSPGGKTRPRQIVQVSKLNERLDPADFIHFSQGAAFHDSGILASGRYLYLLTQGPNKVQQASLGSHFVRDVDISAAGSGQFRGMIYNHDDGKVYLSMSTTTNPLRAPGVLGFSAVWGEQIWELEEDFLSVRQLRSQGGGDIRIIQEIEVDSSAGSTTDWRYAWWHQTAYVYEGKLYAPVTVADREYSDPLQHLEPWRWIGVATWNWEELVDMQANGTSETQWLAPEWLPPRHAPLDVGRDIGFPYGIDWDYGEYGNLGGILGFSVDEQGVGWVQYFKNNNPVDPTAREESVAGDNLYTSLIRYDLSTLEQAAPVNIEWTEESYRFAFTIGSVDPAVFHPLGRVQATSRLPGTYSLVSYNRGGVEASPYFDIDHDTGRIGITPEGQFALSEGVDRLVVRYTLADGFYSEVDVTIEVYSAVATEAIAPSWIGLPYNAEVPLFEDQRTIVLRVRADAADRYRLGTQVDQNWGIDSVTGDLYWAGNQPVPQFPPSYNLEVIAENDGTQFQTTTSASAVVRVNVVDRDDYVAPSWNSTWVPAGYQLHADGHIEPVDTFTETLGDNPDAIFHQVDVGGGAVDGSIARHLWRWHVVEENPDIGTAIFTQNSSVISWVGSQTGTASFWIEVDDGVRITRLVQFKVTWAFPDTEESFVNFWRINADGEGIPTGGLSHLTLDVEEGSPYQEVLTDSADQLFVTGTPNENAPRNMRITVQEGADIITAQLGASRMMTIGGADNWARRVHVYTHGGNLDFETSTLHRAKFAVTIGAITIGPRTYRQATHEFAVRINVLDSTTDEDAEPYRAPQPNPAWRPPPIGEEEWEFDEHFGQWSRFSNTATHGQGVIVIDMSASIFPGTDEYRWAVEALDNDGMMLASDQAQASISREGLLTTLGVAPDIHVTYRVKVDDGTADPLTVADLRLHYQDTRVESNLQVWRDDTSISSFEASVTEAEVGARVGGEPFWVTIDGIAGRQLGIYSSDTEILGGILQPLGMDEVEIDSMDRQARELILLMIGTLKDLGEHTVTFLVSAGEAQVGDVVYKPDVVALTGTITVAAVLISPALRFWRKHRTNGTAEVISALEIVVLQGSTAFRFPVGSDSTEWSDYDYYFTSDALGEQAYTFSVTAGGTATTAVEIETGFAADVALGAEILDAEKLTFVARTDTHADFFEFPALTPLVVNVAGVETRADSDEHSWAAATAQLDVTGHVFFDSDIRVYNENLRTQIYRLDMAPLLEGSASQQWHTLIGGSTYVWAEQLANRTITASLLNPVEGLSVSLSPGLTNVTVLADGGGQETLAMHTLTINLDASNLEDGVILGVVSIVAAEAVVDGTTYPEEEHRLALRGELVASENTTPTTIQVHSSFTSGPITSFAPPSDLRFGLDLGLYTFWVCYPGIGIRTTESIALDEAIDGVSVSYVDDSPIPVPIGEGGAAIDCLRASFEIDTFFATSLGEISGNIQLEASGNTVGGVVYDAGSFSLPFTANIVPTEDTTITFHSSFTSGAISSFAEPNDLIVSSSVHRRTFWLCYEGIGSRTTETLSLGSDIAGVSVGFRDDFVRQVPLGEGGALVDCFLVDLDIDTNILALGGVGVDIVLSVSEDIVGSLGYRAGTAELAYSANVVPADTLDTAVSWYLNTTLQTGTELDLQSVFRGRAEQEWEHVLGAGNTAQTIYVSFPGIDRAATAQLVAAQTGVRVELGDASTITVGGSSVAVRELTMYIDSTSLLDGEIAGQVRVDVPAGLIGSQYYNAGSLTLDYDGSVVSLATAFDLYAHNTIVTSASITFRDVAAGEAEVLWTRDVPAGVNSDSIAVAGGADRTVTAALTETIAGVRVELGDALSNGRFPLRVFIDTTSLEAGTINGTIRVSAPAEIVGTTPYQAGQQDITFSGIIEPAADLTLLYVYQGATALVEPFSLEMADRVEGSGSQGWRADGAAISVSWAGIDDRTGATATLVAPVAGVTVAFGGTNYNLLVAGETVRATELQFTLDTTNLEDGPISGQVRIQVPAETVEGTEYPAIDKTIAFAGTITAAEVVATQAEVNPDWIPANLYPYDTPASARDWTPVFFLPGVITNYTSPTATDSLPRQVDFADALTIGSTPWSNIQFDPSGGGTAARIWYRLESNKGTFMGEQNTSTTGQFFQMIYYEGDDRRRLQGPNMNFVASDSLFSSPTAMRRQTGATTYSNFSFTTTINVDSSLHRQEILNGTNEGWFAGATPLSGRDMEIIVSEGSEFITLVVDDEIVGGWNRVRVYVSGAAMTAGETHNARITVAVMRNDRGTDQDDGTGSWGYAIGAHQYSLRLVATGTPTTETVYKAAYVNFGWVPAGFLWDVYEQRRRTWRRTASRADGNLTVDLTANGGAMLPGTDTVTYTATVSPDDSTSTATISGSTLTITPPSANGWVEYTLTGGDAHFQHYAGKLRIDWGD